MNVERKSFQQLALFLSLLPVSYTHLDFYFSKEGKDERGKKIISTASFISFIITMILLFALSNLFYDIASYNQVSYSWILNLAVLIISGTEAIGIFILKKSI
nr:hypothetical protein A5881_002684 [Enterococcus termitis]